MMIILNDCGERSYGNYKYTWLISWEVIFSFIFGFVINVGVLVFIYNKNILSMYI